MEKIVLVKSNIGQRLKITRIKMGLSQQEVAELMSVRRETIGRWERGSNIPQCICEMKLQEILNNWETIIGMSDKL